MACLHFDFGILASRPMNFNFVFSHQVCGEMLQSPRETDGGMVVISKGDLESLGHSLSCLHESFSSFHLPPPIPHLEPLKEGIGSCHSSGQLKNHPAKSHVLCAQQHTQERDPRAVKRRMFKQTRVFVRWGPHDKDHTQSQGCALRERSQTLTRTPPERFHVQVSKACLW